MITITLILIFAYLLTGRDPQPLINKLKNINWNQLLLKTGDKIKLYAKRVGRVAAKPLLIFYYVLKDESLSSRDKMFIYGCIVYVITPFDLIPRRVFNILGIMDDATAIALVIQKIKDHITPEVILKANLTLAAWFDEPEEVTL